MNKPKLIILILLFLLVIGGTFLVWKANLIRLPLFKNDNITKYNQVADEPSGKFDTLRYSAGRLYQQGKIFEALTLAQQELSIAREIYSGTNNEVEALFTLATISATAGKPDIAEKLYLEAQGKASQITKLAKEGFSYFDFILAGVSIATSEVETIKILGKPLKIEQGEIDHYFEGKIRYKTFIYDGVSMQFYDNHGISDRLKIESSRYATFRGLRVGDSLEKIGLLYGPAAPNERNIIDYQVMFKDRAGDNRWQALIFELNSDNKVKSIEIRPVYD